MVMLTTMVMVMVAMTRHPDYRRSSPGTSSCAAWSPTMKASISTRSCSRSSDRWLSALDKSSCNSWAIASNCLMWFVNLWCHRHFIHLQQGQPVLLTAQVHSHSHLVGKGGVHGSQEPRDLLIGPHGIEPHPRQEVKHRPIPLRVHPCRRAAPPGPRAPSLAGSQVQVTLAPVQYPRPSLRSRAPTGPCPGPCREHRASSSAHHRAGFSATAISRAHLSTYY
jgi:hypothetical protein